MQLKDAGEAATSRQTSTSLAHGSEIIKQGPVDLFTRYPTALQVTGEYRASVAWKVTYDGRLLDLPLRLLQVQHWKSPPGPPSAGIGAPARLDPHSIIVSGPGSAALLLLT